jgi:VWFA-related protein
MLALTTSAMALSLCSSTRAQAPTFKSRVTHVLLDVVVTDKDDRPITGLTAADFEIVDTGKPQTIADFESVNIPLAGRPIESLKAIPGPPPDTFTNAKPPHSGRAIVIWIGVVDEITLAKRVVTEFVRGLNADDRVAVTYGSRSDVAQDFTNDPGLLMKAFDRMAEGLLASHESPDETLRTAVNVLLDAPELRRVIIAVSEKLPWDAFDHGADGQKAFTQLTRARQAGIAVYTLQSSGLQAPSLELTGHLEDQQAGIVQAGMKVALQGRQNLRTISEYTGGRAFVAMPDVVQAARDVLVDTGSYYLLGFYPDPYQTDGKFHEVAVTVKRKDARVRARLGYTSESAKPARAQPLVAALGAGVPGGELELHALAVPIGFTGTWLTTEVRYPESVGPRADDLIDIVWIAIDPDARVRARGTRQLRVPLADAPVSAFSLVLNDVLKLPGGQMTVRLAVASRALGSRGIVHIPLKFDGGQQSPLPAMGSRSPAIVPANSKGIVSTSLLIGAGAAEPIRVVMLSAVRPPIPFQPSTRRRFSAAESLRIWSRVFSNKATNATLFIQQVGVTVREIPVTLKSVPGENDARDCDTVVPLAALSPGRYSLRLGLANGGLSAPREVPFEIR